MEAKTTTFLENAASLYATKVPAIASHLMLQTYDAPAQRKNHSEPACPACGSVLIAGDTELIALNSPRPTSHQEAKEVKDAETHTAKPRTQTVLASTCTACGRFSKLAVPKRYKDKRHLRKMAGQDAGSATTAAELAAPAKPESTESSDSVSKRKKRKKASGLQAMLAKKAEADKTSTKQTLDLMDFAM